MKLKLSIRAVIQIKRCVIFRSSQKDSGWGGGGQLLVMITEQNPLTL